MKRTLKKVRSARRKARDSVLEEFEKRDLGASIRKAGTALTLRKRQPTSIVLDEKLIEKLRKKGSRRGLGYQTMLKMIVLEHVDEY